MILLKDFQFKPAPGYTLLMLILFGFLISLGIWQLNRAEQKKTIDDRVEQAQNRPPLSLNETRHAVTKEQIYRKSTAYGYFDSDHQYLLDNRTHRGRPGYHVYTPFVLSSKINAQESKPAAILINRGWIPYRETRNNIPDISVSAERRVVNGTIKNPTRMITLGKDESFPALNYPRTIQSLSLESIGTELGYQLYPVVMELAKTDKAGFIREWQPYYGSVDKHHAYAAQWFAMAGILFVIFLKMNLKRVNRKAF